MITDKYIILNSKLYKKQKQQEQELVKRLFEVASREIASETLHNGEREASYLKNLTLKFYNTPTGGSSTVYYSDRTITIILNLEGARYRIRAGYTDDYYLGRRALLKKYTLHYLHNEIRFLIYHELKHSIDAYTFSDYTYWPKRRKEYQADCYALKHLKHSRRATWNS